MDTAELWCVFVGGTGNDCQGLILVIPRTRYTYTQSFKPLSTCSNSQTLARFSYDAAITQASIASMLPRLHARGKWGKFITVAHYFRSATFLHRSTVRFEICLCMTCFRGPSVADLVRFGIYLTYKHIWLVVRCARDLYVYARLGDVAMAFFKAWFAKCQALHTDLTNLRGW